MSFDDIIGQEKIKKKLKFFLAAQKVSSISPNILFVAPRGCGKTLMAQTYASKLVTKEGKKRDQFIVNCSVLKSLRTFVDEVLEPILRMSEATLFFDEASEIPEDVRMALLTILNPNKDNKNKFAYGDRNFDIDFKRFTFLFATTEPHKIPPPLADRLERIDLEEYSINNLAAIVKKSVLQDISEAALLEISKVLRGNARKAMQMANHINAYLATSKVKSFGLSTLRTFALLLLAANKPCGESSTIRVSSGKQPIILIAFQYISGCGLEFFTSSLEMIKSIYSIIPIFANITNTDLLIEFEAHANLYPLLRSSLNNSIFCKSGCNWEIASIVKCCFLNHILS